MSYQLERKEGTEQKEQTSQQNKNQNLNRALALGMGKIIFDASFERAKKRGEVKEKNRFAPLETSIGDLREQQTGLDRQRADIAKLFTNFRDKEQGTLKKLQPFHGEEREVLMEALGKKLLPEADTGPRLPTGQAGTAERQEGSNDKNPATQSQSQHSNTEIKKEEKALAEFDKHMGIDSAMPVEKQTEIYLSCFTVLKQENIFKTEDQLNGTHEQELDRTYELLNSVSDVVLLLSEHPGLQSACSMILEDKDMSDFEKAYALSAIADSLEKPKVKNPLKKYFDAAAGESASQSALAEKVRTLERRKRHGEEEISRARENVMVKEGGAANERIK